MTGPKAVGVQALVPPAKTGRPAMPSARYASMARAPRRLPKRAPIRSRPRVWPVIGTKGRGIVSRAKRAMSVPAARISAASQSSGCVAGRAASTRVGVRVRTVIGSGLLSVLLGSCCCFDAKRVADGDAAGAEDAGAKASAAREVARDAGPRECLEVPAGIAGADALQLGGAGTEAAADQGP